MKRMFIVLCLSLIFAGAFNIGCKVDKSAYILDPYIPLVPLPNDLALFASIRGNRDGLWIFDVNTLEKVDSLETTPVVPFSLEFSDDYSHWYIINSNPANPSLVEIDALSKSIIKHITIKNPFMILDGQHNYFITYFTDTTQIFDKYSFNLISEFFHDPIDRMVASQFTDMIYGLYYCNDPNEKGIRIMSFNISNSQVERIIDLTEDKSIRANMQASDISISPNGRYLFVTVFNWIGGGGIGSFYAIDLIKNQIVAEYICGKFSQIGVRPDGKYVYLTDPAGYLYEMEPTGELLRYDVTGRLMEVFIQWKPYNLTDGAWGGRLPTDQVLIAPDNRTMFVTTYGTTDGKSNDMIKVDLLTKEVIDVLSLPKGPGPFGTQTIVKLRIGKYVN